MDVVARWAGSTHDQVIFNNLNKHFKFDAKEIGDYILLVDGGYECRPNILVPLYHQIQMLSYDTSSK